MAVSSSGYSVSNFAGSAIFLIEMDTAERIRQYHNRVEGALHLLRNFF